MDEAMAMPWIGDIWEKAFDTVSRMPPDDQMAAFAIVIILFFVFALFAVHAFRHQKHLPSAIIVVALACVTGLAASAIGASAFRAARRGYRIRIVPLGLDKQPTNATVKTPLVDGFKRPDGVWEFDIPLGTKTSGDDVTFYAASDDSSLIGSRSVVLGSDYDPQYAIQLHPAPSALARGNVLDENGRPVVGAQVSVVGLPESVKTTSTGYFALPAGKISGEPVTISVEEGNVVTKRMIIAGEDTEITLWKK
jgi:hypothetical protein